MVKVLGFNSGILPFFLVAVQLVFARTVPSFGPLQLPFESDVVPVSASTTPTPIASSTYVLVRRDLDPGEPLHTGNSYALDPFGLIGDDDDDGDDGNDNGDGDGDEGVMPGLGEMSRTGTSTVAGLGLNTASNQAMTALSPANTTTKGTGKKSTEATSLIISTSNTAPQSTTQTDEGATTTSSPSPNIDANSHSASSSSGPSMNSWKIIGIGVLALAGIILLVIGFIFHDTLWNAVRRVRNHGEELLVPDWKRGSWRFGGDSDDVIEKDKSGLHIGESEKGDLCFPLPPVSPFPLRRITSTNTAAIATEPANRTGSTFSAERNSNPFRDGSNYSIIPSPPPQANPSQPPVIFSTTENSSYEYPRLPLNGKNRDVGSAVRAAHVEEDAYGGIEDH